VCVVRSFRYTGIRQIWQRQSLCFPAFRIPQRHKIPTWRMDCKRLDRHISLCTYSKRRLSRILRKSILDHWNNNWFSSFRVCVVCVSQNWLISLRLLLLISVSRHLLPHFFRDQDSASIIQPTFAFGVFPRDSSGSFYLVGTFKEVGVVGFLDLPRLPPEAHDQAESALSEFLERSNGFNLVWVGHFAQFASRGVFREG